MALQRMRVCSFEIKIAEEEWFGIRNICGNYLPNWFFDELSQNLRMTVNPLTLDFVVSFGAAAVLSWDKDADNLI